MPACARAWVVFAAVLCAGLVTVSATAAEFNVDRPGGDFTSFNQRSTDPRECEAACSGAAACRAWTYVRPGVQGPTARCWLKSVVPAPRVSACCTSGVKPLQPVPARAVQFCFGAYGNPERPGPGYVGRWQLGPVTMTGSGVVRFPDGALLSGGRINHTDNLQDRRYPFHATTWQVVRALGLQQTGAGTVLRLQVRVTGSNHTDICPVGTYGLLTLIENKSLMPNRQTRDGVGIETPNPPSRASDGGLACRTHTHGMNNTDVNWTDPQFGGFVNGRPGGMWAYADIGHPCQGARSQAQPQQSPPPPHQSGGVIMDPPQ